jgi:hypothetical protein
MTSPLQALKCKCWSCAVGHLLGFYPAEWPSKQEINGNQLAGAMLLGQCHQAAEQAGIEPHLPYYLWLTHSNEASLIDDSGQYGMAGFDVPVIKAFQDAEKMRKKRKN